jgi:hypothetical protein
MNKSELSRLNQEALTITQRTSAQAHESTQIAKETVAAMNSQTDQLTRLNLETEDTHNVLKQNKKIMKDMDRCWFVRLCCFGAGNKRAPSPTKWHSDKDRVDGVIKAKNKEKWIKKETSYVKAKIPPALEGPTKDIAIDAAVDAELARLSSAVDELRDLATEISVQSAVQQRLTEDLTEGVDITRQGVKENDKYFTKIAPKIKKRNQDEYVNSADKLLIKSAAASLKSKVSL